MADESPTTLIQQHVLRGVWTITGILLGINSWLIKEKVAEITTDIKALATMAQTMQVEQAVLKRNQENFSDILAGHGVRIYKIESEMGELRGLVVRRRQ